MPLLPWSLGSVRGGREAGADLLQEDRAAGDRHRGEHEWLCLPTLHGEAWDGVGHHQPPGEDVLWPPALLPVPSPHPLTVASRGPRALS